MIQSAGVNAPAEMLEFWRWIANSAIAVSLYFILQIVKIQRIHGARLNNHSQRLAILDNETENTGDA